ncbi:MAG: hypothetical protein ACKVP2_07595 [Burkholderiales bacterium]
MKILRSFLFSASFAGLLHSEASFSAEPAGELTIRNTALQKMLVDELFIDKGRYPLIPPTSCQYGYLDSPSVTISEGRVRIKVRLSGQLAMEVSGQCVGSADVVRIAVSAQPAVSADQLILTDIQVDEISNEAYRILLTQFVRSAIPRAIHIDLREGVQRMFAARQSSWEVVVEKFSLGELIAENNQLRATVSFSLTAK